MSLDARNVFILLLVSLLMSLARAICVCLCVCVCSRLNFCFLLYTGCRTTTEIPRIKIRLPCGSCLYLCWLIFRLCVLFSGALLYRLWFGIDIIKIKMDLKWCLLSCVLLDALSFIRHWHEIWFVAWANHCTGAISHTTAANILSDDLVGIFFYFHSLLI